MQLQNLKAVLTAELFGIGLLLLYKSQEVFMIDGGGKRKHAILVKDIYTKLMIWQILNIIHGIQPNLFSIIAWASLCSNWTISFAKYNIKIGST